MENEWRLIVIADCHLGVRKDDIDLINRFIESRDPLKDELLFLGDLFHIWAGPEKYHVGEVTRLLEVLDRYTKRGGRVHLNVGNRDIFFLESEKNGSGDHLPFTTITGDFFQMDIRGKKLFAIHGDTVNSKDTRYLKWRRLIRSRLFRQVFNLLPSERVKKIMFNLEKKLKHTNPNFRLEFPLDEWKSFITRVHNQSKPELLLVGHFHPQKEIKSTYGSTTGIVIPDWHTNHCYMSINSSLNTKLLCFK